MMFNRVATRTFLLCFFVFFAAIGFSENQTRTFSKYYARITLPSENWRWNDISGIPNIIATAESEDGITLLFGAILIKKENAINDEFIAGIEKGQLQHSEVSKISGNKLTYCGVPCYQLETLIDTTQTRTINRFFNGHGYSYFVAIMYPQDYTNQSSTLESIFDCFAFTEQPVVKISSGNSAYEKGYRIGQLTANVMICVIVGAVIFALFKKFSRKKS